MQTSMRKEEEGKGQSNEHSDVSLRLSTSTINTIMKIRRLLSADTCTRRESHCICCLGGTEMIKQVEG